MSYILPALNSRILQAFPVDLPRLAKFREPSPNCKAAIKPEMEIHLVSMFMTTALHSYLLGPTDSPPPPQKRWVWIFQNCHLEKTVSGLLKSCTLHYCYCHSYPCFCFTRNHCWFEFQLFEFLVWLSFIPALTTLFPTWVRPLPLFPKPY